MPGNAHIPSDTHDIPAREQQPASAVMRSGTILQPQQRGVQTRPLASDGSARQPAQEGPGTARHADGTPARGYGSASVSERRGGIARH